MKRLILLFPLLLYCMSSCYDCTPAKVATSVENRKEIIIELDTLAGLYSYSLADSNKRVFMYSYFSRDCEQILDENWTEGFLFQVADTLTSFEFSDGEIAEAKGVYFHGGAWIYLIEPVSKGTISGTRLSDTKWKITATVFSDTISTKVVEFEEVFRE